MMKITAIMLSVTLLLGVMAIATTMKPADAASGGGFKFICKKAVITNPKDGTMFGYGTHLIYLSGYGVYSKKNCLPNLPGSSLSWYISGGVFGSTMKYLGTGNSLNISLFGGCQGPLFYTITLVAKFPDGTMGSTSVKISVGAVC